MKSVLASLAALALLAAPSVASASTVTFEYTGTFVSDGSSPSSNPLISTGSSTHADPGYPQCCL